MSRVSCLACNYKLDISSAKNIYKITFTQSGESLALFVSSTLSLAAEKLRSSYLCLRCLNLFGKLEEASRKVTNIKYEIHKVFQDSFKSDINGDATIENNIEAPLTGGTNTQVPFAKPRAVITQCIQKRSANSFIQKKRITHNSGLIINWEKKNTNSAQLKGNRPDAERINLKTDQECLKTPHLQAKVVSNVSSLYNNVVDVTPSLKDHEYTQLSMVTHVSTCKVSKPVSSTKALSIVNRKLVPETEQKIPKSKNPEVLNTESYTCSYCGIKKDTIKDLKLHYKTHSDLYPYMCEKCGKVYKTKKSLKKHIKTHDRISLQKMYTCSQCNKCFTQKATLKRHLIMHTGEKPYKCEICSKEYIHITSFRSHILVHTQEKKYKCDLCPLSFMSSSRLKRHMRIHGGEKKHSCEICGKRFFDRYHVSSHMKIHDPELNRLKEAKMKQKRVIERRCERCKINFASAAEYNVHLRKHTPENLPCIENEFIHGIKLGSSIESACPSAE